MAGMICTALQTVGFQLCCDRCPVCISTDVPWLPSQLTPDKITAWLRAAGYLHGGGGSGGRRNSNRVVSVSREIFAVGEGLMSTMVRLNCAYADPDAAQRMGLPARFVCKLSPAHAKARVIGELLGIFRTEVCFYRSGIAGPSTIRVPRCYFAASAGQGRCCLLLEDMAPLQVRPQHQGATLAEARGAIAAMATLHAGFRGKAGDDPRLRDFLLRLDDPIYYSLLKRAMNSSQGATLRRLRDVFKVEGAEEIADAEARLLKVWETWFRQRRLDNRQRTPGSRFSTTLCHGDCRTENMFFSHSNNGGDDGGSSGGSSGGSGGVGAAGRSTLRRRMHAGTGAASGRGKEKGEEEDARRTPVFVDFQLLCEGYGAQELCYYLNTNLGVELRREHELDLLRLYYEEANARGAGLEMEDFLLEYQRGVIPALIILLVAQADTAVGSERATKLLRSAFERLRAYMQDSEWFSRVMSVLEREHQEQQAFALDQRRAADVLPARYLPLLE